MGGTASELEAIIVFTQGLLLDEPEMQHVFDYEPVHEQGADIPTMFMVHGKIDYWWVECVSTDPGRQTNQDVELVHELVIKGYREAGPAATTARAMRQLTSRIEERFRRSYVVPGLTNVHVLGPLRLTSRGVLVRLAETWTVHHSEGRLAATERVMLG